jgi:hypothetical protein
MEEQHTPLGLLWEGWRTTAGQLAAFGPVTHPGNTLGCYQAMPPLSGCENIDNFIACVAHGILLDVFTGAQSTRVLFAAQVTNAPPHAAQNPPSPESSVERPPNRPNLGAKLSAGRSVPGRS